MIALDKDEGAIPAVWAEVLKRHTRDSADSSQQLLNLFGYQRS